MATAQAVRPDSYYEDVAKAAIEDSLAEVDGQSPEEIRFAIRRNYPFDLPRAGRAYKIWNRIVLETERRLGVEPHLHKDTKEKLALAPKPEAPPLTKTEFLARSVCHK